MRRLVIPLLFSCFTAAAQDVKQEINNIKQNESYMNAEATEDSRDDAFSIALDDLIMEVGSRFNVELSQEKVKSVVKSLEVKRGESSRVFVYALVSDIERLINGISTTQAASQNVSVQPVSTQQNSAQNVASAPVKSTLANATQLASVTSVFSQMNTMTEIKSLLREYQPEGKVSDYNWVKSLSVDPDACIVVFRGENIVAILQQEHDGKRINFMTNSEDNLGNYSGCRAIWYK